MVRGGSILIAVAACGDSTRVDVSADAPSADADTCPGHSTFRGTIRAFTPTLPFSQWPGVSDVTVCDADRPSLPCTQSNAAGAYELTCVPEGEVVISYSRTDYVRVVWLAYATGDARDLDATLLTTTQHAEFYAPVSQTFPQPGYGVVGINEVTHQAGIEFAAAGAFGPFYSPDGVTLDPDATSTTGDGLAFFIAPVGSLTIEITPVVADQICGQASGAFVSTGHGFTAPVFENTEVDVFTACR